MLVTLLPLESFKDSAKVLSQRHLKVSVPNCIEILNVLHEVGPISPVDRNAREVRMWQGHEVLLCEWTLTVLEAIQRRGVAMPESLMKDALKTAEWHLDCASSGSFSMDKPWWLGRMKFHIGIQSLLIRTDPNHYQPFFPLVSNDLPLYLPVREETNGSQQG